MVSILFYRLLHVNYHTKLYEQMDDNFTQLAMLINSTFMLPADKTIIIHIIEDNVFFWSVFFLCKTKYRCVHTSTLVNK